MSGRRGCATAASALSPIVPQSSLFATTSSADEDPSSREPWRLGADPPLAPLVAILVHALGLGVAASWQHPLLDDEVGTMVAVGESAATIVTTFDEYDEPRFASS